MSCFITALSLSALLFTFLSTFPLIVTLFFILLYPSDYTGFYSSFLPSYQPFRFKLFFFNMTHRIVMRLLIYSYSASLHLPFLLFSLPSLTFPFVPTFSILSHRRHIFSVPPINLTKGGSETRPWDERLINFTSSLSKGEKKRTQWRLGWKVR